MAIQQNSGDSGMTLIGTLTRIIGEGKFMINNVIIGAEKSNVTQYNLVMQDAHNIEDIIHPQYISSHFAPFKKAIVRFDSGYDPSFAFRSYSDYHSPLEDPDGAQYYLQPYINSGLGYILDSIPIDISARKGVDGNALKFRIKFKVTTTGSHSLSNYSYTIDRQMIEIAAMGMDALHYHDVGTVVMNSQNEFTDDVSLELPAYPTTDHIIYSVRIHTTAVIAGLSGDWRQFELKYFHVEAIQ